MIRKNTVVITKIVCLALVLSISPYAYADMRTETIKLLAKLRQEGIAKQLPDEMRSLDNTLATAEKYYHANDLNNAERFYHLATQKGQIIQQRMLVIRQTSISRADSNTTSQPEPHKHFIQNQEHTKNAESQPGLTSADRQSGNCDNYQSERLTGTAGQYVVKKGDTIRMVAARLGVNHYQLAQRNNITTKTALKEGQILNYNNRRIIPEHNVKDGLLINIPDRMLYLFQQGKLSYATAVALGTPAKTEQFVWQTPVGKFKVINKAKDPTWTVPPSIQEEMRLEGKEVITSVPPGPKNPLGKYAIKTSLPGILIHSTTKPWSIYTYASHGCIRVFPERMEELFKLVRLNIPGEIIYRPVKLAVTDDGRIFMEAHKDIYSKTKGLSNEASALIRSRKLDEKVDWEKVKKVISRKSGIAEEITLSSCEEHSVSNNSQSQSPS